jgi:hypothetical protein
MSELETKPPPAFKLYTIGQISLAAFLGSPVAATLLMRANLVRLGDAKRARWVLWAGIAATVVLFAIALVLPDATPRSLLPVLYTFGVTAWARALFADPIALHARAQGAVESSWKAAGLSLLMLLVVCVACFGAYLGAMAVLPTEITDRFSDSVTFKPNSSVYYADGASAREARAVGEVLKELGYLNDKSDKDVRVSGKTNRRAVCFLVNDGAWDRQGVIDAFGVIGKQLEEKAGLGPLEIELCADEWKVQKKVPH